MVENYIMKYGENYRLEIGIEELVLINDRNL